MGRNQRGNDSRLAHRQVSEQLRSHCAPDGGFDFKRYDELMLEKCLDVSTPRDRRGKPLKREENKLINAMLGGCSDDLRKLRGYTGRKEIHFGTDAIRHKKRQRNYGPS